jgi:hypothetical protein
LRDSPFTVSQGENIFNPAGCAWPLGQTPGDLQTCKRLASGKNIFPARYYLLGETSKHLVERMTEKRLYWPIVYFGDGSIQSLITETLVTNDDTNLGVIQG